MTQSFDAGLAAARSLIRTRLDTALATLPDGPIAQAMAHALAGGKGLRGYLVLEGARLHGITPDRARHAAAGIEALHAYSLVHDDLPAMDDDALRRGQPTVHIKWDEATAILAGDALQSLAFELVTDAGGLAQGRLAHRLAQAAGAAGMVHGQALDIAAETAAQPVTLPQIETLQAGKTGALFGFAATAGPIMAKADPAPLARYAAALGLAFQIADDILDVTSDAATLGKATQKDGAAGKATFVSLLGLDTARARATALTDEAAAALAPYGAAAKPLQDLARYIVTRDR